VLLSCPPADLAALEAMAQGAGVPLAQVGAVGGDVVEAAVGGGPVRISLAAASEAYEGAIPGALA
jgi:hypothetical protein